MRLKKTGLQSTKATKLPVLRIAYHDKKQDSETNDYNGMYKSFDIPLSASSRKSESNHTSLNSRGEANIPKIRSSGAIKITFSHGEPSI